jgi:hypothetical protein
MTTAIPKNIKEITHSWLSEILGGEVTGFYTTYLEGGVLSDVFKIHSIEYADSSSRLPPQLF